MRFGSRTMKRPVSALIWTDIGDLGDGGQYVGATGFSEMWKVERDAEKG
jgi:hypothetical protein